MYQEIAIIAPGAMGSAIAQRLGAHGVRVITLLAGRSEATQARARAAGMRGATLEEIAGAGLILSIVPPAQAVGLAEQLAPHLARSPAKPVYADCNAIDVATVRRVQAIIEPTGARFVDAAIIGGPPRPGEAGPMLHLAGAAAAAVATLAAAGLRTQVLEGPPGAASALKMAYAGINKGLLGLTAAMALAATRAGAATALREELQATQPQIFARLTRAMPDMYGKAYRWVAEMREIAAFAGEDPAARRLYAALAEIFAAIAEDNQGDGTACRAIDAFLGLTNEARAAAPRQSPPPPG